MPLTVSRLHLRVPMSGLPLQSTTPRRARPDSAARAADASKINPPSGSPDKNCRPRACICGSLTGVVTGMSCPFFGRPVKLEFDPGAVGVSTVCLAARAGSGATRRLLGISTLL